MDKVQVVIQDDRERLVYAIPSALQNYTQYPVTQLLPLPLQLERHKWREHGHFDNNTLLLRSHRSFRCTSQDIIEAVHGCLKNSKNKRNTTTLRAAASRFERWIGGMEGHSGWEEHKLFPYVEKRFKCSLSTLHGQHREIETREAKCRRLFKEGGQLEALLQALVEFDTLLLHHLQLEENCVIPGLLSLSLEEFEWYYNARSATQALGFKHTGIQTF